MKTFAFITLALLVSFALPAIEPGALDPAEIAYDLTVRDMGQQQWENFVRTTERRFQSWSRDHRDSDRNEFLNTKLLDMGPGALSGNVQNLREAVRWLALYREFRALPPNYVHTGVIKYRRTIEEVLKDFSWEKAAAAIVRVRRSGS